MATAAKQRNKRLSQYDRQRLCEYASKLVLASADTSALDNAYAVAAEAVRAEVEKKFPPRDMKVLARYDAAKPDACIYVSRGYGDRDRFCFRDGDAVPLRPSHGGCGYRTFLLEAEAVTALDAFVDADKAFKAETEKRLADYRALIASVNTFNEVVAVWAEAESLRESIVGTATALVVLNNEIVERIQRDAAARLAD